MKIDVQLEKSFYIPPFRGFSCDDEIIVAQVMKET